MATIAFGRTIIRLMTGFAVIVGKQFTHFSAEDFQCAVTMIAVFCPVHRMRFMVKGHNP